MITPLKQTDNRWSRVRIGNSSATLGRYGCTITALCMLLEKLRGFAASPPDAAKYWKFNRKGEILWKSTKFKGMRYVLRSYYPDYTKVTAYANDPTRGVLLEVNHGKHWVYVEKVDGRNIHIIDPLDGKRHDRLPSQYQFTGYALFEADEVEAPEWLKSFWKKAKDKGLKSTSPALEIDMPMWLDALYDMKLIDKTKDKITIGEAVASLDKISERW